MAAASDLRPQDTIKVSRWPGTAGQTFTVVAVDAAKGHVRCWDRDHKSRVFPLANVRKVRAVA